jgi:hypothetical protein
LTQYLGPDRHTIRTRPFDPQTHTPVLTVVSLLLLLLLLLLVLMTTNA